MPACLVAGLPASMPGWVLPCLPGGLPAFLPGWIPAWLAGQTALQNQQ